MKLVTLTYTMSIRCVRCFRHLLVYLIQLHSYIHSLRQVSHDVSCTHFYLFVAPHSPFHGPLVSQELPNNNIARSQYYAALQRKYRMFIIFLDFFFHIFKWFSMKCLDYLEFMGQESDIFVNLNLINY